MLVHDGRSGILGTSHLKGRDFSYFGKSDSPRRSFLLWIRYWQVSPNPSSKLAPLHSLLENDKPWLWLDVDQKALDCSKPADLISSAHTL